MRRSAAYSALRLSLEIELPELPTLRRDQPAELTVVGVRRLAREAMPVGDGGDDPDVAIHLAKVDGNHVLSFGDDSVFEFERATRTVSCPTPLDSTTRHQLLDHVLPRVLDDVGHLMIHGSAINTPSGAVIFIGDTGRGKSTLVASFQSADVELLSDDCMRLTIDAAGGVSCISTYRSLRLWPDSADAVMPTSPFEPMAEDSDKRRLDLPEVPPTGDSTVAAIFVLAAPNEDSDAVTFSPLAPARAVSLLLGQCFRLDPTDADATRRTFERCADVVERLPVVELSYPRDYNRLPDVRAAVLQRAASAD